MNNFIQVDSFVFILGLAQIIIAVFGIFILGLLIKILSDINDVTNRAKTEINEAFQDLSAVRGEAKKAADTIIKSLTLLVGAIGVKKIVSFIEQIVSDSTKTKKASRPKRVKVNVKTES